MRLTIVGCGCVGLTVATCFADMGHQVCCVDTDSEKIDRINRNQRVFFEPYLFEMLEKNKEEGRLSFYSKLDEAIESEIFFITVGTPPKADGESNLDYVLSAARNIASKVKRDFMLVVKSTVPVGTGDHLKKIISEELNIRGLKVDFSVISNPEFLKQGSAVDDFMKTDRIIIGCDDEKGKMKMLELYHSFTLHHYKMIFMPLKCAEMTKYATNAMLATKISFMNEIAHICEALDIDVDFVRRGIGSDSRIGYSFTYPGCGFGGSCFPKDIQSFIKTAEQQGINAKVLKAVYERNLQQKQMVFTKLQNFFEEELPNRTIGVWGLAYKPETDDIREAPAVELIGSLLNIGTKVKAYDPAAMNNVKKQFSSEVEKGRLVLVSNPYTAVEGVDCLVLMTEWKVFRNPDFSLLQSLMANPVIVDGRNQYERNLLESMGFLYEGMGR